jgi:hypothetical protein
MPWVVGALGSRPVRSKGIGRPSAGGREPKGKRHAVDTDTGLVACGTPESLRIFDDWPWAPEDDFCRACEEVVEELG